MYVMGKSRRPESPLSPLPQPIRDQIVTHFTISLNALENRIRAQARDGIRVTLKNVHIRRSLVVPRKALKCFSFKKFAGVPGSIHFLSSVFCFLLLYP